MIETHPAAPASGSKSLSVAPSPRTAETAALVRPTRPTHFLARQPILDLKQRLHGYAMLQQERPTPNGSDDPLATEQLTRNDVDDFLLFMPESAGERGFVPCTRAMIVSGLLELLPAQTAVLQIPAAMTLDEEVLAACAELRKKGYRFALEGAAPGEAKHPLLELAEYILIDFQAIEKDVRREIFRMLQGTRIKPIARNVEKTEQSEMAKREGCQYFQGFFLASSATAARRTIPTNQVICLRLMAALAEENTEVKQIESMVMMDTSLTYQLLRRVNSVAYSLNSRVTSIRNALVLIGNDEFRKLVSIALADVFAASQSKTLITLALERAKFCETLAPRMNQPGPKLYLLGMLSLIDIILQVPMSQVMLSLPIDNDMKSALQGDQSPSGTALELVRAYQAANWAKCELLQQKLDIPESTTAGTYMEAVHWAASVLRDPG